jgi:hypothetical protein
MSLRLETPLMSDTRMSGIAISFSRLMNIVPNGFTQSEMKEPRLKKMDIVPNTTPRNIPMKMRMCRGNFFIM